MKNKQRIIYYRDELNDDFAGTNIKRKPLKPNFRFFVTNPFYRFLTSVFYYLIAVPVFWIIAKLIYNVKVKGKKKLKKAGFQKTGGFIYGNHTMIGDAFMAPLYVALPRRIRIICSQETVSIAFIRNIIMPLGAYPIPNEKNLAQTNHFLDGIDFFIKKKEKILIFPEAHIWPYYTKIRPFSEKSFSYPAKQGTPVVAICTTFKKRKFLKFRRPQPIVHISNLFYPDMSLSLGERALKLRNDVYEFMVDCCSSLDNYEYIKYIKKED